METSSIISPEIHEKIESFWPEILKRIPTKQLGICMCVSKKWNKLITCSSFISSHNNFLSKSQQFNQSSNLFILRTFSIKTPQKPFKELYHICLDNENPKTQTLETLIKKSIVCPFKTAKGFHFRFVGSVNGVIFLSDDYFCNTYNFILWNPILSCFIQLPKPRACFTTIGAYMNVHGFGYDDEIDDFKVIRLVYPSRRDGLDEIPPRAELYSVKEGKWRWVNADNVEYCPTDKEWSQCFLKGSVHWVAFERRTEEEGSGHKSTLLLLFNVVKEKFQMMKLPLELREVCPLCLEVFESQGLLCVNHYVMTEMLVGELVQYNLWVKKEYTKGSSWCKVASVDLRGSLQKGIYWRKNGEVLVTSKNMELGSYDTGTGNVAMLAPPGYAVRYDVCSFVESLAFLNEDCKNRRRFVPKKIEENDSSDNDDEEPITPQKAEFEKMGKFIFYMNQLRKFRRQF
ncbi:F-box/kelch-repeat protein At3g23880-like [Silene latifolia]|uniref:F-box/kelch-repeat protein At3g23880-like n=1 Tax=Silene latifolia TaxID=37657 RepID=UPI003D7726AD